MNCRNKKFFKDLKKSKARLIGHILRHNSLPSRIIGAIEGKKSRGRPPLEYISQIERDMNGRSYYYKIRERRGSVRSGTLLPTSHWIVNERENLEPNSCIGPIGIHNIINYC